MVHFIVKYYLIYRALLAALVYFYRERIWGWYLHLSDPEVLASKKFAPFTRTDFPRWNKTKFLLAVALIAPFKIELIFSMLYFVVIITHIYSLFSPKNAWQQSLTPPLQTFRDFILRAGSEFVLRIIFLNRISRTLIRIDPAKYPKLNVLPQETVAPIEVCNHVTIAEYFVAMMFSKRPSFAAKKSAANLPTLGSLIRMLNCVFIDRFSTEGRESALKAIQERVDEIKEGKNTSPLLIFPEGTPSNGDYVLPFKRGAFMPLCPIRIKAGRYGGTLNLSYLMLNTLKSLLLIFSCWDCSLELLDVVDVVSPKPGLTHEEYAAEVRRIYVEELGFKEANISFREKIEFESKKAGFSKEEYD